MSGVLLIASTEITDDRVGDGTATEEPWHVSKARVRDHHNMSNVILATTMWGKAPQPSDNGERRDSKQLTSASMSCGRATDRKFLVVTQVAVRGGYIGHLNATR